MFKTWVLGITGEPGTGKTQVVELFRELGCASIEADRVVADILQLEPVQMQIQQEIWGKIQKSYSKKDLADRVFSDERALRALEKIIHPHFYKVLSAEIHSFRKQSIHRVLVVEIPLLYETEGEQYCDKVLLTVCDTITQEKRIQEKGWDEARWPHIQKRLHPLAKKLKKADFILDTGRSLAETREQVKKIYQQLQDTACGKSF